MATYRSNQLWTIANIKSILWSFCKGFADSLRFWQVFTIDSQSAGKRDYGRDLEKDRFISRDRSDSPDVARRRALEKRKMQALASVDTRGESDSRILERTIKCCVLNGGLFWLSIVIFESVIMPMLSSAFLLVLGRSAGESLWARVVPFISATFATLWVLPLYLLSLIVNAIWFADIADSAFRKTANGRPRPMTSFSVSMADTIFTIVVELLFLVQAKAVDILVPIGQVGWAVQLLHMCLLHALYCFEYKWFNQGLELHTRLAYVESHWPYFLGFGLPLALVTSIPASRVVSGCVFSILFPLFLVSANQASVAVTRHNVAINIFSPTVALANVIFKRTLQ